MKVLVTGGAGYIGSHACLSLLEDGHDVLVVDNLSNGKQEALLRIEQLANRKLRFIKADLVDYKAVKKIFLENKIGAVMHFAGMKSVAESVNKPLEYYDNNLIGTINLLKLMNEFNVKKIVFSSSATVYGVPKSVPISEEAPLQAINPYGQTKLLIEYLLKDLFYSDKEWDVIILRYFNPIGAHSSGLIGEDPQGIPNNLIPYITQVAIGKLPKLLIYGDDYPTNDGTCVRDYIHIDDLVNGHIQALEKISKSKGSLEIINLGTGEGCSVLSVLQIFEEANQIKIPYEFTQRRSGDVPELFADPSYAFKSLGWAAKKSINEMCKDSWLWQQKNPDGYSS
tara:strand:- start:1997 stop:3013 length:1017 start_codon:yes stop_codon:yes gene_type:complete